jgi:hemerythrin superfamily protein
VPDVVDLILADHREVERMFQQLQANPELRPGLLPVLTATLAAHSRAEEAEVYPAAKDEAGKEEDVEHSQEEHLLADTILKKLSEADPTSTEFDSTLAELVEAVTHHIEEEEEKVLPGLREGLDATRLEQLGEAFTRVRAEHLGALKIDLTKEEMLQQAANAGIEGASSMTKAELERELKAHADS